MDFPFFMGRRPRSGRTSTGIPARNEQLVRNVGKYSGTTWGDSFNLFASRLVMRQQETTKTNNGGYKFLKHRNDFYCPADGRLSILYIYFAAIGIYGD